MTLSELWASSPDQLTEKHVRQVMAFCGSGRLRDGSKSATEFREFLRKVPSSFLTRYADECLKEQFPDSGLALQDVINEVGRRLGFRVIEGRYRGAVGQIGFDGVWWFADQRVVMVEVKTTDVYSMDLDRIADYRQKLVESKEIPETGSSVLIVVGRENTGNLEAQIRGSRHAWDMRLISVDALVRLMSVKEGAEDPATHHQIQEVLVPREFTRIDGIIELVFRAAEDVRQDADEVATDEEEEDRLEEPGKPSRLLRKRKFVPVAFHAGCVERIQQQLGMRLLRRSRATYSSVDETVRVVCSVSRPFVKKDHSTYWFAFHPHQKAYLDAGRQSYVAYGCGSPATVLLVPFLEFSAWLSQLNITQLEDRSYWHVHIRQRDGRFELHQKEGDPPVDLTRYLL